MAIRIDDSVREQIREALAQGTPPAVVAVRFQCSVATVYNVKKETFKAEPRGRLTDVQVQQMRSRRAGGETLRALVAAFKVSLGTVQRVCDGTSYRHVPASAAEVRATSIVEDMQESIKKLQDNLPVYED